MGKAVKRSIFGKMIAKWRIDNEMTLQQMCDKVGIDIASMSYMETGKKALSEKMGQRLLLELDFNDEQKQVINETCVASREKRHLSVEQLKLQVLIERCISQFTADECAYMEHCIEHIRDGLHG